MPNATKLIIGLGNIGKQYSNTRHNLGFAVVDLLAISLGQDVKFPKHAKVQAEVCNLSATHQCLLAKPTTMMNASGQAVRGLMDYYNIQLENVWVIYDDVDLDFGQVRIRRGGGSAGHNGINSIITHAGDGFWRIRLGIANQYLPTTPTDKFVLDQFNNEEAAKVPDILRQTADHVASALIDGQLTDHTQNLITKDPPDSTTPQV